MPQVRLEFSEYDHQLLKEVAVRCGKPLRHYIQATILDIAKQALSPADLLRIANQFPATTTESQE
jgi:hypothetical protein